MNKLEPSSTFLAYPTRSDPDLGSSHRLIVLVPTDADCRGLTRRIWQVAESTGMHILLLGLCRDTAEEPGLRRELITMASLLQADRICTEATVKLGTNWVEVVKAHCRAGDVIVCFAEQRIGLLHRPLSQVLESNFNAPVYILSSLAPEKPKSNGLSQVSAWLGSIGIILGFSLLQANLVQLPGIWLQNILLIVSIIPEFWLLWAWNGQAG